MHRIFNAAKRCGYLQNVIDPIDPRDANKLPREKIVYLCTGSQGEPMGALNRISNYSHPDVSIENKYQNNKLLWVFLDIFSKLI